MSRKQITDMSAEELLNLELLQLDDTFEFACRACGKCCKQRRDLILTPFDIFRIANCLSRSSEEIIKRYCEVYIGRTSHMPVVRVLPVGPDAQCPFLNKKKCFVHSHKPVICRVYPLARIHTEGQSGYYFNDASCNHEPTTYTVREWIADIAEDEAVKAGETWTKIMFETFPYVQPEKFPTEKAKEAVLTAVFTAFYLAYDIKRPFTQQLESNYEKLKELLGTIDKLTKENKNEQDSA